MSITLNGTVGPSKMVPIMGASGAAGPGGLLKFMFSAPQATGPQEVSVSLDFFIGPTDAPDAQALGD
jgi:hypothetical protein